MASARDAILLRFRTAWLADPASASVLVLWDDVQGDAPGFDANGNPTPYVRVTVRHLSGEGETLGGIGAGRDKFEGRVIVQVFTPKGQGHASGDVLAEIAKKAFLRQRFGDTTDNSGWFFDVFPAEVPGDRAHDQINVQASFRYAQRVTA